MKHSMTTARKDEQPTVVPIDPTITALAAVIDSLTDSVGKIGPTYEADRSVEAIHVAITDAALAISALLRPQARA